MLRIYNSERPAWMARGFSGNTFEEITIDWAPTSPTAQEIASLVAQRLIRDGGLENLANANRMTIEERSIEEVDRVTRLAMDELFAK